MDFQTAANFLMPFGKHKGKKIDQVAIDDLRYLDWLYGENADKRNPTKFDIALKTYMEDPSIKKELENL